MIRILFAICLVLLVSACSPNYWRCSYGNPSNWDANTLEFCKYYKQGS
ncbi:MAG: hypothetical protein IKW39_00440 [Alphaproteobacteria bacterium]|nr:hypothetical protein [Alphaproteobacteria bacterium]